MVNPMSTGDLTAAEIDAITADTFPVTFTGQRRPPTSVEDLVLETGPLTQEHVDVAMTFVESGDTMGVKPPDLVTIRHTHHKLAQLLAVGTDEIIAAKLCNYTPTYVSILKSDPAFAELLAYYHQNVVDEFADFVAAAKGLSMDLLMEMQTRLNTDPSKFTITQMKELVQMLADRTGHAPVQKSVQVNINADAADRLARARARVRSENASVIDG